MLEELEVLIMDVTGNVVMTTWTRTSEEHFQQLVGSVTPRMKEFWRTKEVQPGSSQAMNKEAGECINQTFI